MKPPEAPEAGISAAPGETPPAVSARPVTLAKRPDFTRAARALSLATPGFVLQARLRRPGEAEGVRVGFTCSKKVGNAVARNRAKRRLREIAWQVLPAQGREGVDYVLIGRRDATATCPFDRLVSDLTGAVRALNGRLG